jgi:rfaE bifunctional protein nucleotidyltransferase chain/domain
MCFNKVFNNDDLRKHLNELRKKDLIIGFTNGCFDLLHKGHLSLLSQSKLKCDYLIVGLNSDTSITILKGKNRPIDSEAVRINNLSNIKDVDAIIIFKEETPFKIINELLPNTLFKGADYKHKKVIGSECVIKNGGKIEFIDILDGFSTTNIIKNSSI